MEWSFNNEHGRQNQDVWCHRIARCFRRNNQNVLSQMQQNTLSSGGIMTTWESGILSWKSLSPQPWEFHSHVWIDWSLKVYMRMNSHPCTMVPSTQCPLTHLREHSRCSMQISWRNEGLLFLRHCLARNPLPSPFLSLLGKAQHTMGSFWDTVVMSLETSWLALRHRLHSACSFS